MEIPCEIYSVALEYLRAKGVSWFRAVSKEHCRMSQVYEGDDTPIKQVKKWHQCFPKAKVVNLTGNFNTRENDFIYFTQAVELTLSISRIRLLDDLFLPLQHLKHLNLLGYDSRDTPFQDGHCKHLTHLKSLTLGYYYAVTDDGLLCLTELEQLTLRSCREITSRAIRGLKRLKRLEMYQPYLLTDDAFEGSNLEELKLTYSKVSDVGICHLKRLNHLTCFSTPNVCGKGFDTLLNLEFLWLSDVTIRNSVCNGFGHIRELHFYNSSVECEVYDKFKKIEAIYFYESKIYPVSALEQLNTIPSFKKIGIYRCDQMSFHRSILKSVFGNKLMTY